MRYLLLAGLLLAAPSARSAFAQEQLVYLIPISGPIENGLAPFVARALSVAKAAGARAVVLDIDTPGGRIDAAERIVDAVRAAGLPVYAFVNPRAYSAGAMIALATQGIYMTSGAVIGAATPVDGQGTKASEKIVSAMRGEFRALAEARGLDPRVAEGMVDESLVIPGVKAAGALLTLTTEEAMRLGFAKAVVTDVAGLLSAAGLPSARVAMIDPNWAEVAVRFLTSPLVSPLLLSLGMLGLILSVKAGHFGIGSVASLTSLGLFFGSGMLVGLAGWEEVILLALGFVALGVEAFILPGFGVAGVIGLGLITTSIVLALVGTAPTGGDLLQAGAILATALVITGSVLFVWIRHIPHSARFRRIMLQDGHAAVDGYVSAPARDDLVGQSGTAVTDLRPSGTAEIGEERIDVVTEGEYVPMGAPVTVLRSEGYRHIVRAVKALHN